MSLLLSLAILLVVPIVVLKIYCVLTHRNCKSKVCLVGKTALVTGGNSGIGYQTVLDLVRRGCRVIIADKVEDKNLLENIYKETRSRNVAFKYVDLSSFKSVKEFADKVIKEEERLDILINNAGIASDVPKMTDDGLDITMQINYFSAFLLTQLLEDSLKKTKGRIIFTSSGTSYVHSFTIDRLKPSASDAASAYPNSKLCVIMISDTFAERLGKYGVTSNTYHPGLVNTTIFKKSINLGAINYQWLMIKFLEIMALLVGKTAEEGAQTAMHLACANEVEDITGEYFFEAKTTPKPKLALDKKTVQSVWTATEEIVKSKMN